jgi:FkbM family methyltransferase
MHIREFVRLHNVKPNGVLHVGAHLAEEAAEYEREGLHGSGKIIWIEAQKDLAEKLIEILDPAKHKVFCGVAWNKKGEEVTFKITSKSASSSILDFGTHKEQYPDIKVVKEVRLTTTTIDALVPNDLEFEMVILDIQGAEAQAIIGLGERIQNVKWIYSEVSKRPLYVGGMLISDFDELLKSFGFRRVFTEWDKRGGWGDALYARAAIYSPNKWQKIGISTSQVRRLLRSLIPQAIFPLLVKVKKIVKFFSVRFDSYNEYCFCAPQYQNT